MELVPHENRGTVDFPFTPLNNRVFEARSKACTLAASDFGWCSCYMTHLVLSPMAFHPAARCCRLPSIVCCVLTLWAALDSQVLLHMQTSSENLSPISQNPSPGQDDNDDDDYVLELTGKPPPGWVSRRNVHTPAPGENSGKDIAKPFFLPPSYPQPLPTAPAREHEFRNGIGANLLC
jgi:hypothetical protein